MGHWKSFIKAAGANPSNYACKMEPSFLISKIWNGSKIPMKAQSKFLTNRWHHPQNLDLTEILSGDPLIGMLEVFKIFEILALKNQSVVSGNKCTPSQRFQEKVLPIIFWWPTATLSNSTRTNTISPHLSSELQNCDISHDKNRSIFHKRNSGDSKSHVKVTVFYPRTTHVEN